MRNRELQILTAIVSTLVALDGLITPVIMLWAYTLPESYTQLVTPIAATVDGSALFLRLSTMVAFSRWIYVAGLNVVAMGHDSLEFTPAARIWWFAVPIACLFKPFQGMRELWNASHGEVEYDRNQPLIAMWWALWVGAGLFTTILSFSMQNGEPGLIMWAIDCALGLGLAVVAIFMLWGIAVAQLRSAAPEVAEIFA